MKDEKKISPELLQFIEIHTLTLAQLIKIEDHILLKMDGFGYRMLLEVLQLRDSK